MIKTINRSWLKLTAFVLSCFLNVISFAQDKGLDLSYSEQQPSTFKINSQQIDLKTKVGIFPAFDWNLKTPVINLPDTFLSKRSACLFSVLPVGMPTTHQEPGNLPASPLQQWWHI